ncbi:MAG TPA: hypothetical protein VFT06_15270 [Flavisolibacter sp.]|nr:hypothetical protein [Flavisolibacter sp.]
MAFVASLATGMVISADLLCGATLSSETKTVEVTLPYVEKMAASESAVTFLLTFLIVMFMYLFSFIGRSKAEDIKGSGTMKTECYQCVMYQI